MAPYNVSNSDNQALAWINGRYETVTKGDDGYWYRTDDNGKLVKVDPNDLFGMNSKEEEIVQLNKKIEALEGEISRKEGLLDYLSELFYTSMKLAHDKGQELYALLRNNDAQEITDLTDTDIREEAEGLDFSKADATSTQHSACAEVLHTSRSAINDINAKGHLECMKILMG